MSLMLHDARHAPHQILILKMMKLKPGMVICNETRTCKIYKGRRQAFVLGVCVDVA